MALRPDVVDFIRQRFEISPDLVPLGTVTSSSGVVPAEPPKPEYFVGVDFARPGGDYTVHVYRNEAKFIAIWSPKLR